MKNGLNDRTASAISGSGYCEFKKKYAETNIKFRTGLSNLTKC